MKLEQEQSKKWVADEDADNCTKCNVAFGWTVRRVCFLNDPFDDHSSLLASLSTLSEDFL